MKNLVSTWAFLGLFSLASGLAAQPDVPGTPTSMVVTIEPKHGKTIPPIESADIEVQQGKQRDRIVNFEPAGEGGKKMQLLLLISDSARGTFNTEISILKRFITSLPGTTEVGIGYMLNGTNQMASNFTQDHAAAAESLRLVLGPGGADVSPYDSLSEAIKQWPAGAERRAVIMISSGMEGLGGGYTPDNPYVNKGIADAQRAGIQVYTIYNPASGYSGRSFWRGSVGQNFLSQLADETGGESYMIGLGSPVSFQPFLDEIKEAWQHQYTLTFEAKPEKKTELQPVRVRILEKDASIAAADKVLVKAGM